MRTLRFTTTLLGAGVLALLIDVANAHGGDYRGPVDRVPPSPGGARPGPVGPRGPTTGGQPSSPTAPAPTAPGSGGPTTGPTTPSAGIPGGRSQPRTGGGYTLENDFGSWDLWWEFNKDSYLRLRDALASSGPITGDSERFFMGSTQRSDSVDTQRPSLAEVTNRVLPALRGAMAATRQRDITSACMIAMAKIGQDHPEFRLVDVFAPALRRGDQELRETAALALGIAARVENGEVDLLAGLALDDPKGRAAVDGEVDPRTRSFALYGLGLLAHEHDHLAIKTRAFEVMNTVLGDERTNNRDLKVAAIHGMSLLNVGRDREPARVLQDAVIAALAAYYRRDLGASDQVVQAHCPTAIAKLIGRHHTGAGDFRAAFARELRGEAGPRQSHDLARSCALALGQLCEPHDGPGSRDAEYSELLLATFRGHKDEQTRSFAVLALGQIGGSENRKVLLHGLRHGKKAIERPWCALALGVMARAELLAQAERGGEPRLDTLVGEALAEQLEVAQEPGLVGALGVALGLCRHRAAAPAMQQRMLADLQKESQAGYLCLGLGLMGETGAKEDVRKAMNESARRPDLLKQAAVALGLLGDKSAAELLRRKLTEDQGNLATLSSLSAALGLIGDRTSLDPLQRILDDKARTDLARAFAAVAIGGIADRAMLPWHAKLAANLNYRAAVATLTDQQSGILDIL
jgi:hypothetical protein